MTDDTNPSGDHEPAPPPGPQGGPGAPGGWPYGGTPAGGPYGGAYTPTPLRPEDEKLWATLIHLGGILFAFVPALLGYVLLRDRGPFITEHTRVALNFQLSMLIGYVLGGVLTIIFIGALIVFAVSVIVIVFSIIAAVAANRGQYYRYPLGFEFIKR